MNRLARLTGDVVQKLLANGRPHVLNGVHMVVTGYHSLCCHQLINDQYLEAMIDRKPDSHLKELQKGLWEHHHVWTTAATISNSLHPLGLTYKKVICGLFIHKGTEAGTDYERS